MASAGLVVIRADAGKAAGLRWELERARNELSPEKVVLWFPNRFKGVGYKAVREVLHEAMKVEFPESCPKGFVTFDANWQPRPAKSEIEMPEPPSVGKRSGESGLIGLLEQLEAKTVSPPPFHLHPVTWVAIGLWLILLWGIPGERFSFYFYLEVLFGDLPHFVSTILEGAATMTVALGLAFIPYFRNPTRRLLPSLVLCAVLALDVFWIIARTS
jgi:hypothetical protein